MSCKSSERPQLNHECHPMMLLDCDLGIDTKDNFGYTALQLAKGTSEKLQCSCFSSGARIDIENVGSQHVGV